MGQREEITVHAFSVLSRGGGGELFQEIGTLFGSFMDCFVSK